MAYVLKNEYGQIVASSPNIAPDEHWEFIESDNDAYIDFLEQELSARSTFRESDIQMARVLEDLIGILIERGLIQYTDFPSAAQKRMGERQTMRRKNSLTSLLGDDDISF